MAAAEEKRLDGQWRGNLGFDLKFAVEVDSGGVAITNEGSVVPGPAWSNGLAGEDFFAATEDELALGVEAERFASA